MSRRARVLSVEVSRDRAEAVALLRAVLVARLMGVDPEWGRGAHAAPGWWLETWGRRLALERLTPTSADAVNGWLQRASTFLADWPEGRAAEATRLHEEGLHLEALVAAELGYAP